MYNIYKTVQYQTQWKYPRSTNIIERQVSSSTSTVQVTFSSFTCPLPTQHPQCLAGSSPTAHPMTVHSSSPAAPQQSIACWPGRYRKLRPGPMFSRPWQIGFKIRVASGTSKHCLMGITNRGVRYAVLYIYLNVWRSHVVHQRVQTLCFSL